MTLGFTQTINGKPNYFPEKIIMGLDIPDYKKFTLMDHLADVVIPYSIDEFRNGKCNPLFPHKPKLHTIRTDPSSRWKAGMDIHMVINNRTKNRFQFAPVVKCTSVQVFELEYKNHLLAQNPNYTYCVLKIDGVSRSREEIEELAINDGFDSVEDFFKYFNKDFKGKLIHWTDLKY